MLINEIRYFVRQVFVCTYVNCCWDKGRWKRKTYSSVQFQLLVFYRCPQIGEWIMADVFVGFEAGRNSVEGVKDKISDPAGES